METTNQFVNEAVRYLSDVLLRLGLRAELKTSASEEDGVVLIHITTDRDELLIGRSNEPLLALQHLLRIMLKTALPTENSTVSLNVGDYQERQQSRLAEVAKTAAQQVRETGLAVYLPEMSSFERRLVHLALQQETNVRGESEGVGSARRIVVKPAS
jgi:spoIIIJ-associated protein